jgi:hypothetical protein
MKKPVVGMLFPHWIQVEVVVVVVLLIRFGMRSLVVVVVVLVGFVGLSLILLVEYVVLWLDCDGVVWLLSVCWTPKGLPCPIGGPG